MPKTAYGPKQRLQFIAKGRNHWSAEGGVRRRFFSPVARFWLRRASREALVGRVFLRFRGVFAAATIKFRNFSRQSSTFLAWSRYRWLVRTNSARSLIRRAERAINRTRTSSGIDGLVPIGHRSTAFEATLLTFWPPGPELRTNVNRSSRRGMAICALTRSIEGAVMPEKPDQEPAPTR